MGTSVKNESPLSNPGIAPQPDTTIGSKSEMAAHLSTESAESFRTHSLFKRLHLLASLENEKLVDAYFSFFSQRENLTTLSTWGQQNQVALELYTAGLHVWMQPGLTQNLELVHAHQLVKEEMRGQLGRQYLASMASAARPTDNTPLSQFIQQLRLLVFIRSLEALVTEKAIWESNIRDVSTLLRKICDVPKDPRSAWLMAVVSDGGDFDDFCHELRLRCDLEAHLKTSKPEARAFFRSLRVVANGGPWRVVKELKELNGLLHYDLHPLELEIPAQPSRSLLLSLDQEDESGVVHISGSGGRSLQVKVVKNDTKQSPARNRIHGTGVTLETLEEMQFLRNSWHHLSKSEDTEIDRWLGQLCYSNTATDLDRIGAAITQIAIIACRTAHEVETLKISPDLDDDWAIHPDSGKLHRIPPRFKDGWDPAKADLSVQDWLSPRLSEWNVSLWQPSRTALVDAISKHPDARNIAELWHQLSPSASYEKWFLERIWQEPTLQRLSGPSLAHVSMVKAYEAAPNQGLVRLLGSQPRTGLPAACAYGAYKAPAAKATLVAAFASAEVPMVEVHSPSADEQINACGSFLDIDLRKVSGEVSRLITSINDLALNPSHWIEYHNKLTSLLVISLYASTGGRPVNSPFESLAWFDFQRKVVYLEDKVVGPTRSSRICVLSEACAELLQKVYLPHLNALSQYLQIGAPGFSHEIARASAADPEAKIPLFFFLKATPDLDWIEVTETQLTMESQVSWPLPWNLFRHIHATELIRRGLNAEIVDALLSHGDRGAETHGDLSLRIPEIDIAIARPFIEALQADLGIVVPLRLRAFPLVTVSGNPTLHTGRAFGRKARRVQRQQRHESARAQALREITEAIADRPVDTLSSKDWEGIAHDMLIRKNGLPHSAASLRYEVFEGYVESLWQEKRKLTRIRRIYSVIPEATPIFNEDCIKAPQELVAQIEEYEKVILSLNEANMGPILSAVLAAIDLVLYSKVSFFAPLKSLVHLEKTVQIVKFQNKYWFEWSDGNAWRDGRPVFRVHMTARAAKWATLSQLTDRKLSKFPAVPSALVAWGKQIGVGNNLQRLLKHLSKARDQLNAWELPGTDAAHLGGRLVQSALPHCDWYRSIHLKAPLLPAPDDTEEQDDDPIYFIEGHHKARTSQATQSTPELCAALFDRIQVVIQDEHTRIEAKRAEVEHLLRESGYGHGDMPFIFGHFLLRLLTRKSKRGTKDGLRMRTVERYFQSMKGPLCDIAHDCCLSELDGDEITDLYVEILEWWNNHFLGAQALDAETDLDEKEESSDKPRLSPQERADDAARRTLMQLREFHAFAVRSCRAEDPEWSQITNGNIGSVGRPGFVLLSEYRFALQSILNSRRAAELPDLDLAECFTLFVCARFGLRMGEAVGLFNNDWVELGGTIVLLVRANSIRPLKTVSSRRQVPLIGTLDKTEREVIDEIIRRSKHALRLNEDGPLLPGIHRKNFKEMKHLIGADIRQMLKVATANENCTAHMLRHSFATRTLATLRGKSISAGEPVTEEDTIQLRKLLLGTAHLDRRALWAVCRLLGHRNPRISIHSYLHGMECWTQLSHDIGTWNGTGPGARVLIDLDAVSTLESYGKTSIAQRNSSTVKEHQLLCLLKCWRLIAQGFDPAAAVRDAGLDKEIFQQFVAASSFLKDEIPTSSDPAVDAVMDLALPFWRIPISRFDALITLLSAAGEQCAPQFTTFDLTETIGRRRQIVLFQRDHFLACEQFLKELQLSADDVVLTKTNTLAADQEAWLKDTKLQHYMNAVKGLGTGFRVDAAYSGPLRLQVTCRVGLMPNPSPRKITTTFELMFLWLGWCICSALNNRQDTEVQLQLPLY